MLGDEIDPAGEADDDAEGADDDDAGEQDEQLTGPAVALDEDFSVVSVEEDDD